MMAFFMRPLYFYRFVCISTMTSVICSILGTSMTPLSLTMKFQNFEYILSWEAANNTQEPRYYSVMYKKTTSGCLDSPEPDEQEDSSNNNLEFHSVKECSKITHSFCNLTNEFRNPCKVYIIVVKTFPEYAENYSVYQFLPYTDTCSGPPEFNISACPDCVNVSVKILPSLLKVYKKLDYAIKLKTVDFEEQVIENNNTTERGNFYTVFEGLRQNTNYCVSVDVSSSSFLNRKCAPSPWKCIVTSSKDKSDHIIPILCGILVSAVGVPVLFLWCYIHRGVKSKERPEVLETIHKLNYSLFDSEPDDVHPVQMIRERWKTIEEYSYDDESGNGQDAMYTTRKPLDAVSESHAKAEIKDTASTGCSSTASDCQTLEVFSVETEDSPYDIKKEDSATDQIVYPPEMNSTSISEPEDRGCLNINLNTVQLELSSTNLNALATLVHFQDTSDLHEPCVSDDSEPKHFADIVDMQSSGIHDASDTWQNYSGSEESESSDSEIVGEYMRR